MKTSVGKPNQRTAEHLHTHTHARAHARTHTHTYTLNLSLAHTFPVSFSFPLSHSIQLTKMSDFAEFEEGTEADATEEEWEEREEGGRAFYFNEDEEDLSSLLSQRSSDDVSMASTSSLPSLSSPSPPPSPSLKKWTVRLCVFAVVVAAVVVGVLVGTSKSGPIPFQAASPQVIVDNLGTKRRYQGGLKGREEPPPPSCHLNHMEFLGRHGTVYVLD